jgi:hypothetical protein
MLATLLQHFALVDIRSELPFHNAHPLPIFNSAKRIIVCPYLFQFSSGVVKRSKLKRSGPKISDEAFMEDLDVRDLFTTLTELLIRHQGAFLSTPICARPRLPIFLYRKLLNAVNVKQLPTVG